VLARTLSLLQRHVIPAERVELWTSDEQEAAHYREVLDQDSYWNGLASVRVGQPGIRQQRNHIVSAYPEGTYLVSLDDDVTDVHWKGLAGSGKLHTLPNGTLENVVFHAHELMRKHTANIWGFACTTGMNPQTLWLDGVSTRNGEINGFFYGFLNRHATDLLPQIADATEDAERSLRYFSKDKKVLRYRMYCCETKPFAFAHGLQELFPGRTLKEKQLSRKDAEREAATKLHEQFQALTFAPQQRKGVSTLEVRFRHVGGCPVPTTTIENLQKANELDKAATEEASRKCNEAVEASGSCDDLRRADETIAMDGGDDVGNAEKSCDQHFQPSVLDHGAATFLQTRVVEAEEDVGHASEQVATHIVASLAVIGAERQVASATRDESFDVVQSAARAISDEPSRSRRDSLTGVQVDEPETAMLLDVEDMHAEGAAENAMFEAAVAAICVPGSSGSFASSGDVEDLEIQVVRRSVEDAWEALALEFNGDLGQDAVERALRLSLLDAGLPEGRPPVAGASTRGGSTSSSSSSSSSSAASSAASSAVPSGIARRVAAAPAPCTSAAGGVVKLEPMERTSTGRRSEGGGSIVEVVSSGDESEEASTSKKRPCFGFAAGGVSTLVMMGFARRDAVIALQHAGGDLEIAANMLLSAARS